MPVVNLIKHFTIVVYNSRVILTRILPNYDFRVVIYARKMFVRLATDLQAFTDFAVADGLDSPDNFWPWSSSPSDTFWDNATTYNQHFCHN